MQKLNRAEGEDMMMKFNAILISILLSACGAGDAPHSETRDYLSGERQLYVTSGEGGGYCVYDRLSGRKTTLITTQGALSADQLGESLSYMSYGMQAVSSAATPAAGGYTLVKFLQQTTKTFEYGVHPHMNDELFRVVINGLLLIGTAFVLNGIYRIIKGNIEGESAGAIAAQFFLGWMPANFIVEDMQRRGRLETLANQHERVRISERKINKIIAKLNRMQPTYPDACPQT